MRLLLELISFIFIDFLVLYRENSNGCLEAFNPHPNSLGISV